MNEIGLLEKVLPGLKQHPSVFLGPGDDCAALELGADKLLLAAVDQVVSDIHYLRETTPAEKVAAKLLKRNLSDIAAMGGVAQWALLALASNNPDDDWFAAFYDGLRLCAEKYGISMCGGDLASLPAGKTSEVGSLTILGSVEQDLVCLRSGAVSGDLLVVTGSLGNSFESEHHLDFEPRLQEGRFLAENGFACAMIDISDGLLLDSTRLGLCSGLALQIDTTSLPLRDGASTAQALGDGEDYELLFAVNAKSLADLISQWAFETKLTCIGKFIDGNPGDVYNMDNVKLTENYKSGYEHTSK
ncbi:MAG: thiamine-monophosphate kinase [Lentisphaerae bacterium]|nr:thiamine-monophosphate kinase [Lentisphaerota bacterium]MCP4103692.1 thiamine-monophosphate kinase [Lentisphaerota bacterium]